MSTRYLYIARHAWAGHFGDPQWPRDSLRELDPEGIERYRQVVERLAKRGFAPEIVATSPYARCRQTAELIACHARMRPEVVELEALEPGSDIEFLLQWSRNAACQQICWVGHAPDVNNMAAVLVGDGQANIRFAKGAVAAIRLFADIDYGAGELYWHATAKLLGV
jgi:phosphohistidine phosphatase SixA